MPDANDKEKEGKKEYDSIKNVEDASKKTADYLLGNLKTDELKADEQKDQNKIQSKNQEIEAKDAGGDTDYANITEKIAYGILIIGAIAIAGLIICSLLVAIFSTPIPAIVFSVFAATASVTACLGLATYISKFFVGIGQSVARTKFKGSSAPKSKKPEIKQDLSKSQNRQIKQDPKVSNPDPPKKAQTQLHTQNTQSTQNNQHALKIRSNQNQSTPQENELKIRSNQNQSVPQRI